MSEPLALAPLNVVALPIDRLAQHKTSKSEHYCTPPEVLAPIREFFGGAIDLDPCSNARSVVNAARIFRLDWGDDGLSLSWSGRVFCNPPYGPEVKKWAKKMKRESAQAEIVGLVAARPDTKWLQDCGCGKICFWRGRMKFINFYTGKPDVDKHGKPTGAVFPSAILYYGSRKEEFQRIFSEYGKVCDW